MKRLLMILVALIIVAGPAFAQMSEEECFARGGYLDEDGSCVVELDLSLRMDQPAEFVALDDVQAELDAFYADARDGFIQSFLEDAPFLGGRSMTYELSINYTSFDYSPTNNRLVSLVFDIGMYTGGAHPNNYVHTMLIDTEADRILSLEDLFRDNVNEVEFLYSIVEPRLRRQLENEGFDETYLEEESLFFRDFALTSEGLRFYFEPYAVAPYVFGTIEVLVPMSAVRGRLASEIRALM